MPVSTISPGNNSDTLLNSNESVSSLSSPEPLQNNSTPQYGRDLSTRAFDVVNMVNPPINVEGQVYDPYAETVKNPQEAKYIKDRVATVMAASSQIAPEARADLPPGIKNVSSEQIEKAEIDALRSTERTNPEKYKAILYESNARAEMMVAEIMGQHDADYLYDQVKYKTGELMQSDPELSQKMAAAMAIATLGDTNPNFKQIDPMVHGAFYAWAIANIEINRLDEEERKALKEAAMQKIKDMKKTI